MIQTPNMQSNKLTSTLDKARTINLDTTIYGSFAEIGAGQEVTRFFFQAGGASKTIAKTMSAYDMVFSDAIYGKEKTGRYVCQSRLTKMLDKEYELLEERLGESRGKDTKFFAFANTVAAKSARGINDGRGWVGIRFQTKPKGPVHEIVLHVKLKDPRNILQQEALGIAGTNLIYGAFTLWKDPKDLILSLMDGLDTTRAEINFIKFSGPEFKKHDNHILNLHLVQHGFTDAVMFDQHGQIIEPSDMLYGKHVVVLRGRYRPITNVHMDIIESGLKHALKENKNITKKDVIVLAELTLNNLTTSEKIDAQDFLARVETLAAQNIPVMISNFAEYYKLKIYFNQIKHNDIRILMGANMLKEIFNEKHYEELQGGILEGLGDIFKSNCKLLVYPFKDESGTIEAKTYKPAKNLENIYQHFLQNKMIEDIEPADKKCLDINTQSIVSEITSKNKSWESKVPAPVVKIIKDQKLFGHK
jgi:hypothetical protein